MRSHLDICPQRAGYSLQELFLLSRSQVIQQRTLSLSTLANILSKVPEPRRMKLHS